MSKCTDCKFYFPGGAHDPPECTYKWPELGEYPSWGEANRKLIENSDGSCKNFKEGQYHSRNFVYTKKGRYAYCENPDPDYFWKYEQELKDKAKYEANPELLDDRTTDDLKKERSWKVRWQKWACKNLGHKTKYFPGAGLICERCGVLNSID